MLNMCLTYNLLLEQEMSWAGQVSELSRAVSWAGCLATHRTGREPPRLAVHCSTPRLAACLQPASSQLAAAQRAGLPTFALTNRCRPKFLILTCQSIHSEGGVQVRREVVSEPELRTPSLFTGNSIILKRNARNKEKCFLAVKASSFVHPLRAILWC